MSRRHPPRRETAARAAKTIPASPTMTPHFSVHRHLSARGFLVGVMRFVGEHFIFRAAGASSFLAADFFNLGALRGDETVFLFLNFVEQQAARDVAVESLLARLLAFHRHAGRTMHQHHTGRNLVHVLSAVAAGADKTFLDVRLAHTQRGHALRELVFFFEADGKGAHTTVSGPSKIVRLMTSVFATCGPWK